MKFAALTLTAAVLLSSCASTGNQFAPVAPPSGEAQIYVYRVPRVASSGGYPTIALDGRDVAPLKNGGFLRFPVGPGRHTIEQRYSVWNWDLRADPVVVDAAPGRTYFVRMDTDASAMKLGSQMVVQRGIFFGEVPEAVAAPEIKQLRESQ